MDSSLFAKIDVSCFLSLLLLNQQKPFSGRKSLAKMASSKVNGLGIRSPGLWYWRAGGIIGCPGKKKLRRSGLVWLLFLSWPWREVILLWFVGIKTSRYTPKSKFMAFISPPRLVAGILWFKGVPRWGCSVYPLSFSLCQCCPVAWQCQIARHLTPNSKRIGSLNPSPRDHFSRKPSGFVGPLILRHTSPYKTTSLDLCQNRRKPNLVDDFEKQSFCNVLYQFKFVSGPPFEAKIAPENWCFAN